MVCPPHLTSPSIVLMPIVFEEGKLEEHGIGVLGARVGAATKANGNSFQRP